MRRPGIELANHRAVYDYYAARGRDEKFTGRLARMLYRLYRPAVDLSDETVAVIGRHKGLGKGVILAFNHPSPHDPFLAMGALYDPRIRHHRLFSATGLAKDSLFRNPVSRPIFELTGCIPVFRTKNYQGPDAREVRHDANGRALGLAAQRMLDGDNLAIMPEGTNSAPDERIRLRPNALRDGVAEIALIAAQNIIIAPFAAYYGDGVDPMHRTLPPRHAVVVAGTPITEIPGDAATIKSRLQDGIQAALDRAVDLSRNGFRG